MQMIQPRSIPLAILLTIVTFGIYPLYWIYKLTEEVHAVYGQRTTASGGLVILFSFLTCGIYSLYWYYKMGNTLDLAKVERHIPTDMNTGILYLIIGFLTGGLIANCLMQDNLNTLLRYDSALASSTAPVPTSNSVGQNEAEAIVPVEETSLPSTKEDSENISESKAEQLPLIDEPSETAKDKPSDATKEDSK